MSSDTQQLKVFKILLTPNLITRRPSQVGSETMHTGLLRGLIKEAISTSF